MSWLNKFIVDPKGQWAHPGKPTMIPNANGKITMAGVPYPVLGIDDQGNAIQMMPGGQYQFPGNNVYEIPMAQMGGDPSIPNLSDKGWLSKYQDGGDVKSFGSRFEYIDDNGEIKLRRKGNEEWKVLDKPRSEVFQKILTDINNPKVAETPDYVESMMGRILGNTDKVSKVEKKPEAENPVPLERPIASLIAPSLYETTSGVTYPEAEQNRELKEVSKYSMDPEFQVVPYKDTKTAISEYQKTPNYALRFKNVSDYTPDDISKVQSYLDKNGYFSERKKPINIDEYKTPEQILELQKYLVKEGLIDVLGINNDSPDGNLSGKLDKNTRTAIEQYNLYNKKFNSGQLDQNTREAIRTFQNKTDAKNRLGVSVADPFQLYDSKTGEPNVELTNKAMKQFEEDLMKRGFFKGNVNYDISSKAVENPRIAFKFTLNSDPTTAFGHCAQYVNGTVCKEDVVGEEAREELGFKGSAWQISENLQNKGGSLVFAGLPERSQIKLGDASEINNYLKTTLTSADAKNTLQEMVGTGNVWKGSSVKPGDVVNIFFEGSSYTKEAYNQTAPLNNRFFTTHVGIVKADDQGNLYVEHNVHGKVEKDKLQDFVDGKVKGNGKNKVSLIAGITRPNYFDGVDNDGRIPAAGMSYYQTEYGQFNPQGALANDSDYAARSIAGETTYKFLSTIEKNKDAVLKDIPISENEFGKLMRVARVIPTLETYAGSGADYNADPNALVKGLQDTFMPNREKSMGITSLKDETNINEQLRSKLYESDYDLSDPVKAGLPTFYVLSKNYLYLKEVANEYELDLTSDQLAKLAGLSYNQSIGKVAAELIQKGGYDNYIKYRRDTAKEGDGKFKYHGIIDLYDKQTMKHGGWLKKYQDGAQVGPRISNLPKEEKAPTPNIPIHPVNRGYVAKQVPGVSGSMKTIYVNPETGQGVELPKETEKQMAMSNMARSNNVDIIGTSLLGAGMAKPAFKFAQAAIPFFDAPLMVGSTTVPGVTLGNVINAAGAGYSTEQILNPESDLRTNPNPENVTATALGFVGLPYKAGLAAMADDLGTISQFVTTQTPVKNAYKLRPGVLKENPDMYLYRARPVGQNPDMNMVAELKAREAADQPLTWWQKSLINSTDPRIAAREKYYGQWFEKDPSRLDFYINPGTRNFQDADQIELLRTKLPKSEAAKLNVSQFEDANLLSYSPETEFILPRQIINSAETFPESSLQQLIQEDKVFNTPHWWKGYSKTDVPKQLPDSPNSTNLQSKVIYPKANQPLPQYMEPYLGQVTKEISGDEKRFRSFLSPEGRAELEADDIIRYNPDGTIKRQYGGWLSKYDKKDTSVHKNQYINNVTLSKTSSWLNKYK